MGPTNQFEALARSRKANRILNCLDVAAGGQIVPRELAALDAKDWARAATIAGCRPPSETTKRLVAELVRERSAFARDVAGVIS